MVFINTATRQMAAKIVYYGPGLSGKTTNLEWIYKHTDARTRGEMVSLETETDRTLFFDLLPIEVGTIGGFRTRFQLYTVPGQVFYNSTRKLVLRGVDGIVFVADSQKEMMEKNIESLNNLKENLQGLGLSLQQIPIVFQYNKRDLKNLTPIEVLNPTLNPESAPYFEAIACKGIGVFETLKAISRLTLIVLREKAAPTTAAAQPVQASPAAKQPAPTISVQPEPPPSPVIHAGGVTTPSSSSLQSKPRIVSAPEEKVEFARITEDIAEHTPIQVKKVALRSISDIEKELTRLRQQDLSTTAGAPSKTVPRTPSRPSKTAPRESDDILKKVAQVAEQALSSALPKETLKKVSKEIRKHIKVRLNKRDYEQINKIGIDLDVLGEGVQRHFTKVLEAELEENQQKKRVVIALEIDLIPKE